MAIDAFLRHLREGLRPLPPQTAVLVAVSGGPDSVALLRGLVALAPALQLQITVGHFNHRWRTDATADAAFVAALASRLGLPIVSGVAGPYEATGSREEAARLARYRFLEQAAVAAQLDWVITGHTRSDQAETILMAILRGTGLHGLVGMPAVRPLATGGVCLIRPLLEVDRELVLAYLQALGQDYCHDPSNDDDQMARNWVRQELLPQIRHRYNPRIDDALLRLAHLADQATQFIDKAAAQLLEKLVETQTPQQVVLRCLPDIADRFLLTCALRQLLRAAGRPRKEIGQDHLQRLAEMLLTAHPPSWDFPGGLRAERQRDRLHLRWSE